jgi:hypothetical protein
MFEGGKPIPKSTGADRFRKLALELPGAVESSHMGHPDFRLNQQIFATLAMQEQGCGVLKLTLDQQQCFITELPEVFSPVDGGWGRMGMTLIHLKTAETAVMKGALETAYRNVQQMQSARKTSRKPRGRPIKAEPPSPSD